MSVYISFTNKPPGTVAVLMSTYNGEAFINHQIDSIVEQTYQNWELWISDDGSVDATLSILKRHQDKLGRDRIHILQGPQKGFCENFLSLVCNESIKADFFAFCDQDDVWLPSHLSQSVAWLDKQLSGRPALACGRTNLVNSHGEFLGRSPLFAKSPSFKNALVQSLAGSNTMVFNSAARQLLLKSGVVNIISHDWWLYILVTGAGGIVFYNPLPTVNYRQHGMNIIGSNTGFKNRLNRVKRMFQGKFREWNECNLEALQNCRGLLSEPNQQILDHLFLARNASFSKRCLGIMRAGVYRQTFLGNLGLAVAACLGKL